MFVEILAKYLKALQLNEGALFQHVDGIILIASKAKDTWDQNTVFFVVFFKGIFIFLKILLFIFGCAGSSFPCEGFL